MQIVRFTPAHLAALELQDAQIHLSSELTRPGYGDMLAAAGQSFSALAGDRVVCVAGLLPQWEGRAIAWALLSRQAGRYFLPVHRAVHGFLAQSAFRRVEAFVDAEFSRGCRWLEMLGFDNETPGAPMRKYTPDGKDCFLYARVK